jgi:hypothetical protein
MKRSLFVISAFIFGIYFIWGGCTKEIKGPPRSNIAPMVDFVNIPVEDARFSSDTVIYFYGTDVDGFIKYFRHAVIESTIVGPDPDAYILTTPDDSMGWTMDTVSLDETQTKQTIRMSADISDPVRKYVPSYVFLQAIDNLGAKSTIVYRKFRRNNHFPNTTISASGMTNPYVNTESNAGVLVGVELSFGGTDAIDYPRNPPDFEYHWKFFGPYTYEEMSHINATCIESVFVDNYGDFYYDGDTLWTVNYIDTTIDTTLPTPDTTIDTAYTAHPISQLKTTNSYGSWGPFFLIDSLSGDLDRLVEESYDPLTNSYWVYDETANIYDVYRYQQLPADADTTREQYFIIWCQNRDEAKTPDPTPAYNWVSVIEPKFEREILLVDATRYGFKAGGSYNWPAFPRMETYPAETVPMVKSVYGQLANNWKPGCFDTLNILPRDTVYTNPRDSSQFTTIDYDLFLCTQDYYTIANLAERTAEAGTSAFSLRDVLKHKIILIIKDSPTDRLDWETLEGSYILRGLQSGMSAWSMVRSPFRSMQDYYPELETAPTGYILYFGILQLKQTAWAGCLKYSPPAGNKPYGDFAGQLRNEDFIGASSLLPTEFPALAVDTTLLEERYYWVPGLGLFQSPYRCPTDSTIMVGALPEVGYVVKTFSAEPIYLYKSMYGNEDPLVQVHCGIHVGNIETYQGSVVAVRYATSLFRTAHFSFSLLPFEMSTAQTVFNNMMDWLSVQPYINVGKVARSAAASNLDIQAIKDYNRRIEELRKQGLLPTHMVH